MSTGTAFISLSRQGPGGAGEVGGQGGGEEKEHGIRYSGGRPGGNPRQTVIEFGGQGDALADEAVQGVPGDVLELDGEGHNEAVGPVSHLVAQGGQAGEQHGKAAQQQSQFVPHTPQNEADSAAEKENQSRGGERGGQPAPEPKPTHQQRHSGFHKPGQPQGKQEGQYPGQQHSDGQPHPGGGQSGTERTGGAAAYYYRVSRQHFQTPCSRSKSARAA